MLRWLFNLLDRHPAQIIETLSAKVAQNRKLIGQLEEQVRNGQTEVSQLTQDIKSNRQQIDQLSTQLAEAAQADIRNRKEIACRQMIGSAIARYFIKAHRSGEASIPFEAVSIDSNPDWMPEILARTSISEPEFIIFKYFNQDTGTVLDIGANYGYGAASIWAAGATSKILSFEPNPWHVPCLRRIKELRPGRFDYINLALGSRDSQTRFVLPVIEGIGISALGSATIEAETDWSLPENVLHHMMHDHPDVETPRLQFTEVTWRTERLDDVLSNQPFDIDLSNITAMKIDVEGFEADVLDGAAETLRTHKPLIMIEGANRNPRVLAGLSAIGYGYADLVGDHAVLQDQQSTRINGFFLHRDKFDSYRSINLLRP